MECQLRRTRSQALVAGDPVFFRAHQISAAKVDAMSCERDDEQQSFLANLQRRLWVWGAAADFDQWAYEGCEGWDYASLKSVFQSIETCARKNLNSDRGTNGPMHAEPVADPNPLSAGFFKASEEMGHQFLEDVGRLSETAQVMWISIPRTAGVSALSMATFFPRWKDRT